MSIKSNIVSDAMSDYLLTHASALSPELMELYQQANETFSNGTKMQTSPAVICLLQILIKSNDVKSVLEVGTFAGFSALAMASVLPDGGRLVTCDINEETVSFGRGYWQKAGLDHCIESYLGDAVKTLESFKNEGREFDFCYIDANKSKYLDYYEACLAMLKPRGMIVVDNTLWKAEVLNLEANNMAKKIQLFNDAVVNDQRVQSVIIPLGDGLTLITKE